MGLHGHGDIQYRRWAWIDGKRTTVSGSTKPVLTKKVAELVTSNPDVVLGKPFFRGRISIRGTDGKELRPSFYGATSKEVRDKIKEAKRRAELGIAPTNKETVAQYLVRWHDKDTTLRHKSIHSRKLNIARMTPHFGGLKLTELGPNHIETMYKRLSDQLSDYSLAQVNAVLRKAMKDAVKEGSIIYNPIDRVLKQPTAQRKEMETLSSAEVKALLDIDDDWTPLFTLLTGTGLRIGEALGLAWDSVDLEHGLLNITRSLQNVSGLGFIFNEPKTEASKSDLPLTATVVSVLKIHQARQAAQRLALGKDWEDQGLVFPNSWGGPMWDSTAHHALKRSLASVGIDRHINIHDLRRTAGSLMAERGVPIKQIQGILRHAHYSTTMDIYVKNSPESLRDAANMLEDALTGRG